jgi:hypothetical protein
MLSLQAFFSFLKGNKGFDKHGHQPILLIERIKENWQAQKKNIKDLKHKVLGVFCPGI